MLTEKRLHNRLLLSLNTHMNNFVGIIVVNKVYLYIILFNWLMESKTQWLILTPGQEVYSFNS